MPILELGRHIRDAFKRSLPAALPKQGPSRAGIPKSAREFEPPSSEGGSFFKV